ncbi:MAG TPA: glycosyltransferase family 39 protein [Solirubrobacterales bacterium]|nr:glycosyltransferase family 39 protein [Solirubrobacterales bacterium]
MNGLAARNGGRIGLAALVAILLLGLGLRGHEAWSGRPPVYDAQAYAAIAANLERGEGFALGPGATQPASNYSPGLPLLAGGIYAIAGGIHERAARLVLALIGALSVLFAYLIARRLAGPFAGLVAALAVAVYPALLEYQGMLMSEPLAATLLSGAVLAMLWADRPRDKGLSARYWLAPGLLLGALALVRPEYLAISFPIAVVVFARRGRDKWRTGLVQALVMLAGLAIVVVPWTVRNEVALGRFVPISTGGGQVLFAGSYLPSDGDPEKVGAEVLERHPELRARLPREPRLEQILAALAHQRHPELEADAALARMGRERLWDDVSEQPLEYLGFLGKKLWLIWGHGPRDVMHEPFWAVFHWLLLAFGLLGLAALAYRRSWEALLLGTVVLAATAIGLLLVASPRRALVTVPLLAALAGAGAAWVGAQLNSRIRH